MATSKPLIAIVGRPNVGKSTLFNAFCGRRQALVFAEPGITRDRQYGEAEINGRDVLVVDTGGFLEAAKGASTSEKTDLINQGIWQQVRQAIQEADVVVAVLDGRAEISAADLNIIDLLRPLGKPVVYAVNKIDSPKQQNLIYNFFELGIDAPVALSAEHKLGMGELKERIAKLLPEEKLTDETRDAGKNAYPADAIRLAVIGRPNVGKSSLVNALLGEERSLVTPIPGTTRDAVDAVFEHKGQRYCLVDTAGVRRKGKSKKGEGVEGLSVIKTIRAIEEAHVVILVLDLQEGPTEQDAKVAALAHKKGRGICIFGNKLDLLPEKVNRRDLEENIFFKMPFLKYAPVLLGSALKRNVPRAELFSLLQKIERARHLEVSTTQLNQEIRNLLEQRSLPVRSGKRLKIFYATQAVAHGRNEKNPTSSQEDRTRPSTPTFIFFVNAPEAVHFSDERFLVNCLRHRYGFMGNPIRLQFRRKEA